MTAAFRRVIAPTLSVDRLLLSWGLLLSVLAAACGAGLLVLSGWFLAMCAAAGGGLAASFSYLYPSGGVRGLAVGRVGTRYLERLVSHRISLDAAVAHRTQLFQGAGARRPAESKQTTGADVLGRLTTDVDTVDSVLIRVVAPTVSGIVVAGAVVALLGLIDWRAAAVAAGGTLALLALAVPATARGLAEQRQAVLVTNGFRSRLVELLTAAPELASYDISRLAVEELGPSLAALDRHHRKGSARTAAGSAILPAGGLGLGILNAVIVSGFAQGPTRVASLAAVAFATVAVVELAEPLTLAWSAYGHIRDAADRLDEIAPSTTGHPPLGRPVLGRPVLGRPETPLQVPAAPAVCFDQVSFRLGSADLDELGFRLDAPGTLVIAGRSGAGKSTLVQLLTGALVPQAGRVRLFGRDPAELFNAERAELVVAVDQQPLHISGTVAENLRLGRADAADEELEELLHAFRLDRDGALTLTDRVAELGLGLSAGQRRRLAIARAVLKRPAILALDEPTEGLDARTAETTLAAVRALLPSTALVLVLHDRNLHQLASPPDRLVTLRPTWTAPPPQGPEPECEPERNVYSVQSPVEDREVSALLANR